MSSEVQDIIKGIDVPDATPSPSTFDLGSFIQQKATTPIVGVTVYLDADGGKQLQAAYDQKAIAEARIAELETMPNPVLAVGESNPLLQAKSEAESMRESAQSLIDQLTDRVLSSALYVEFQHSHDAVLDSQRQAREDLPEDADEKMSANQIQKFFMNRAAAAICVRITNTAQQVIEGPISVEQLEGLATSLIETESVKLYAAVNEAIGVGNTWSEKLDAGFPRRSADVAR